MKLNKQLMKKIEKFAYNRLRKKDVLHKREHIDSVIRMCGILAKREKADFKICKAAALLHDIEKAKNKKARYDHAKKGAETARKFLRKLMLDEKIIEQICYAIYKHNKGLPNKTIESRVVHDADNLDGVGARGLLRHVVWEVDKAGDFNKGLKAAIKNHESFYRWLQTKSAKEIGKKRMKETEKFLRKLE